MPSAEFVDKTKWVITFGDIHTRNVMLMNKKHPSPFIVGYPRNPNGHVMLEIEATEHSASEIKDYIQMFLDNIDVNDMCEDCGGLPYEMFFKCKGKTYLFSLTKVLTPRGKLLAETDYDKLHDFVKKGGKMYKIVKKNE